jgi:hypothetical protein
MTFLGVLQLRFVICEAFNYNQNSHQVIFTSGKRWKQLFPKLLDKSEGDTVEKQMQENRTNRYLAHNNN